MSVVDIPVGNLDSVSELMDWIAVELVANHRFTEVRRDGSIGGDDITVFLDRPASETFHGDNPMGLIMRKGGYIETATTLAEFAFNVAPELILPAITTQAEASVIVDFVETTPSTDLRIVLQSGGAFTDWTANGYSAGQIVRVQAAASGANNGRYEITTISTTTLTNDTIQITEIANGGRKDITVFDTADTITVSEETIFNDTETNTANFCCGPRSDDILWHAGMSHMDGPPFIRARFISSPTSNSATPSEELYFIVVVEAEEGVYRKFIFGEVVKLLPFTGGLFFSSDIWDEALGIIANNSRAVWLQGPASTNYDENSRINGNPGGVFSSDFTGGGVGDGNGRGFSLLGARGSASFDAPTHYALGVYPHYQGAGGWLQALSPSGFSGQSEAYPITVFGVYNTQFYTSTTDPELAPMGIYPDVFFADITNVDPYDVFQNSFGEKFMVVPFYSKAGSGVGSSEKWGYLIRNPDLVVT